MLQEASATESVLYLVAAKPTGPCRKAQALIQLEQNLDRNHMVTFHAVTHVDDRRDIVDEIHCGSWIVMSYKWGYK